MLNAIGGVELSSIAKGYQVADHMLKTSDVKLILSRSICPGKYLILISGDVGEVNASVEAGISIASYCLADNFVIPNIHEDVLKAIENTVIIEEPRALGVIEAFSVSAIIEAADAAVKAADVKLIEIRLAMALGGKGFVTMTGSVASVETAVNAGAMAVSKKGLLVDKVIIPNPRKELFSENI
ncbi:MAG TPA: BMC domain-containing protein [Elusimicrobiales bacterium]|nr:BMC domain-containing protein [Elusimicrobiales bacterium]HOL62519.1 BMC domain-containing protein [Elusimicrobiales bacterium]HPO94553.1 BMC domain-containing protein [Elusimicrobiales bacterium]